MGKKSCWPSPELNAFQIAAQTTTVFCLSQEVRLFPAGCQSREMTEAVCSDKTVSGRELSSMFQMNIFPLADPTEIYWESGVKTARVQSQPTLKPSEAKVRVKVAVRESINLKVSSRAHARRYCPFLETSTEVTLPPNSRSLIGCVPDRMSQNRIFLSYR